MKKLENKTGFSFEDNITIGDGLIIGHWGKIVINGQVQFGNQMFITHGVTVGRDIRGKEQVFQNLEIGCVYVQIQQL